MDVSPVTAELRRIWRAAGCPSMRTIVARSGNTISVPAAHSALSGRSVPRLKTLEAIGTALGADVPALCDLWTESRMVVTRTLPPAPPDTIPMGPTDGLAALTQAINNLADAIRGLSC